MKTNKRNQGQQSGRKGTNGNSTQKNANQPAKGNERNDSQHPHEEQTPVAKPGNRQQH